MELRHSNSGQLQDGKMQTENQGRSGKGTSSSIIYNPYKNKLAFNPTTIDMNFVDKKPSKNFLAGFFVKNKQHVSKNTQLVATSTIVSPPPATGGLVLKRDSSFTGGGGLGSLKRESSLIAGAIDKRSSSNNVRIDSEIQSIGMFVPAGSKKPQASVEMHQMNKSAVSSIKSKLDEIRLRQKIRNEGVQTSGSMQHEQEQKNKNKRDGSKEGSAARGGSAALMAGMDAVKSFVTGGGGATLQGSPNSVSGTAGKGRSASLNFDPAAPESLLRKSLGQQNADSKSRSKIFFTGFFKDRLKCNLALTSAETSKRVSTDMIQGMVSTDSKQSSIFKNSRMNRSSSASVLEVCQQTYYMKSLQHHLQHPSKSPYSLKITTHFQHMFASFQMIKTLRRPSDETVAMSKYHCIRSDVGTDAKSKMI